jgi:hypothetical protein
MDSLEYAEKFSVSPSRLSEWKIAMFSRENSIRTARLDANTRNGLDESTK